MSAIRFVSRCVSISSLLALSISQANADVADAVKPIATPAPVQGFVVKTPNFAFQPFAQLQAWATYSRDRQAQMNTSTPTAASPLQTVDDRANFFFRRARVGIRGVPYQRLNYTLSLFYDNVGHDSLSNTRNATNPATGTGGNAGRQNDVTRSGTVVGVWDAFLTWKINESSDLAHVTAGYFRPQISRESLTPAFSVNSFEKAISQNYVRQAVIGRGFGRAVGVNVGGLLKGDGWGTRYNVGVFNRVTTGDAVPTGVTLGETQGNKNSLVSVARAEVYVGDPEMEKYGLGIQSNFFGRRNGITIAVNGSHQDRTPNYFGSRNIGADILWNWRYLTIELEGFLLDYKSNTAAHDVTAKTGMARVGYSIPLKNGSYLEPAAMLTGYFGKDQSEFTGRDVVIDGGLNWYLDENRYKFYLHYTHQDAEGSNLGNRPGVFSYGDYYGLGLTLQI